MKIANHSKSFYGKPNPGKEKNVYKVARLELGRFVRIVTGHNNLNFFQNKIDLYHSGECRFCELYNETITHFMAVCPRFITFQREILLNKLPMPEMTWSVCDLLDFSYVRGINEAM